MAPETAVSGDRSSSVAVAKCSCRCEDVSVALPNTAEYGRCPCSGVYQTRRVDVRMMVHGESLTLDGVPQGACPQCGSRVYKGGVLECVESLLADRGSAPSRPLL